MVWGAARVRWAWCSRRVPARTDLRIMVSISPIQTSTEPRGYSGLRKGTCSFSAETISDISCSAPLIVIVCTASKHLRRWGCTADGSFV